MLYAILQNDEDEDEDDDDNDDDNDGGDYNGDDLSQLVWGRTLGSYSFQHFRSFQLNDSAFPVLDPSLTPPCSLLPGPGTTVLL